MSQKKKTLFKGTAIAGALALVLVPGAVLAKDTKAGGDVHCTGVNDCKGKGGCKSASNDCKGQNACKGQGWKGMKSEKACTDKHGTVAMAEKKE